MCDFHRIVGDFCKIIQIERFVMFCRERSSATERRCGVSETNPDKHGREIRLSVPLYPFRGRQP